VITRHRSEFEVRLMCRVLEVSPSGYYASLRRSPSWHALIDEILMARVRIIHEESNETYGAPRVHRELQAEGLPASPKRVARLMREEGLMARPRKRHRVSTTDSNHDNPIAPNLLAREFDVNGVGINRVWVSDITYIPMREGVLYLATVLDLGSHRCVGWAMRDTIEVELALSALRLAGGSNPGPRVDSSFRSRESIHVGRRSRGAGGARHRCQHERQGRLLRQRGRRELFLNARVRAVDEERLAHPRGCSTRDLPVHRDVVQPEATPFHARLHQSSGVRTAAAGGRVVPITHASIKSGQAQFAA
jgi:putative transposase